MFEGLYTYGKLLCNFWWSELVKFKKVTIEDIKTLGWFLKTWAAKGKLLMKWIFPSFFQVINCLPEWHFFIKILLFFWNLISFERDKCWLFFCPFKCHSFEKRPNLPLLSANTSGPLQAYFQKNVSSERH